MWWIEITHVVIQMLMKYLIFWECQWTIYYLRSTIYLFNNSCLLNTNLIHWVKEKTLFLIFFITNTIWHKYIISWTRRKKLLIILSLAYDNWWVIMKRFDDSFYDRKIMGCIYQNQLTNWPRNQVVNSDLSEKQKIVCEWEVKEEVFHP